jgi:hypothetical protein
MSGQRARLDEHLEQPLTSWGLPETKADFSSSALRTSRSITPPPLAIHGFVLSVRTNGAETTRSVAAPLDEARNCDRASPSCGSSSLPSRSAVAERQALGICVPRTLGATRPAAEQPSSALAQWTTTSRLSAGAGLLHQPGIPQVNAARDGRAPPRRCSSRRTKNGTPDPSCLQRTSQRGSSRRTPMRPFIEAIVPRADAALSRAPTSKLSPTRTRHGCFRSRARSDRAAAMPPGRRKMRKERDSGRDGVPRNTAVSVAGASPL